MFYTKVEIFTIVKSIFYVATDTFLLKIEPFFTKIRLAFLGFVC